MTNPIVPLPEYVVVPFNTLIFELPTAVIVESSATIVTSSPPPDDTGIVAITPVPSELVQTLTALVVLNKYPGVEALTVGVAEPPSNVTISAVKLSLDPLPLSFTDGDICIGKACPSGSAETV